MLFGIFFLLFFLELLQHELRVILGNLGFGFLLANAIS
jgi:hypothetical protein